MNNSRDHNLMPEEIFSKKNRMAEDSTLCKTLFYDIMRQAHFPAAIASVDAFNCYNRIAHAMASIVFQAFGVPTVAIVSMLGAIENMKFILRTGFGNSTSFAGGGISIKTQGLCQGNGTAPIGWAVISICTFRSDLSLTTTKITNGQHQYRDLRCQATPFNNIKHTSTE